MGGTEGEKGRGLGMSVKGLRAIRTGRLGELVIVGRREAVAWLAGGSVELLWGQG